MFLHLGGCKVIPSKDVIAIIDMSLVDEAEITAEFYRVIEEEGFLEDISEGNPKSMVITGKTVYLSAISPMTLKNRADNPME